MHVVNSVGAWRVVWHGLGRRHAVVDGWAVAVQSVAVVGPNAVAVVGPNAVAVQPVGPVAALAIVAGELSAAAVERVGALVLAVVPRTAGGMAREPDVSGVWVLRSVLIFGAGPQGRRCHASVRRGADLRHRACVG